VDSEHDQTRLPTKALIHSPRECCLWGGGHSHTSCKCSYHVSHDMAPTRQHEHSALTRYRRWIAFTCGLRGSGTVSMTTGMFVGQASTVFQSECHDAFNKSMAADISDLVSSLSQACC
jgi:hypothetical protein